MAPFRSFRILLVLFIILQGCSSGPDLFDERREAFYAVQPHLRLSRHDLALVDSCHLANANGYLTPEMVSQCLAHRKDLTQPLSTFCTQIGAKRVHIQETGQIDFFIGGKIHALKARKEWFAYSHYPVEGFYRDGILHTVEHLEGPWYRIISDDWRWLNDPDRPY